MSDNIIHAAVYCPVCGAKVRYQFPAGAHAERQELTMRRFLFSHYLAEGHTAELFVLEISVEGLPRNVGPFPSREAAMAWLDTKRPFTGSWLLIPLTAP